MTFQVSTIADVGFLYVWASVECEQRSVCRGNVRPRGGGGRGLNVDVRYSARRLTRSLSIAKGIAENIYSSYVS